MVQKLTTKTYISVRYVPTLVNKSLIIGMWEKVIHRKRGKVVQLYNNMWSFHHFKKITTSLLFFKITIPSAISL